MQYPPSDEPEHDNGLQLDYEYYIPPPPSAVVDEEPRWTRRRVFLLVISIIVVLAMLITFYLPGIMLAIDNRNRPPQATPTVLPQASLPQDDFILNWI